MEAQREVRKKLILAMETLTIPRRNQTQIDKLVALYRSCVGSLSRGGNSVDSLKGFLRLHNLNWPGLSIPDGAEFFDFLLELDIRWHLGILFTYKVDLDEQGRKVVVLYPISPDR